MLNDCTYQLNRFWAQLYHIQQQMNHIYAQQAAIKKALGKGKLLK